jgi:hypothetical protein
MAPGITLAGDLTETDFQVKTTADLIDLCTVSPDHPLYPHAVNFCHGYLVGAFHYYLASTAGPNSSPLVCFPESRPTRNEMVDMFVTWTKGHPEHWGELPVETEFRFLMEKWPCSK